MQSMVEGFQQKVQRTSQAMDVKRIELVWTTDEDETKFEDPADELLSKVVSAITVSSATQVSRNFVLMGLPATGKTRAMMRVASALGWPSLQLLSSSLQSKYIGESGKLCEALSIVLKQSQPICLLFDEAEMLLLPRNEQHESSDIRPLQTWLLSTLLQGNSVPGLFVFFTTNLSRGEIDAAFNRCEFMTFSRPQLKHVWRELLLKHSLYLSSTSSASSLNSASSTSSLCINDSQIEELCRDFKMVDVRDADRLCVKTKSKCDKSRTLGKEASAFSILRTLVKVHVC
jgi:SpoVK/Ycf46/Vps4 family AAA+-type ATPase